MAVRALTQSDLPQVAELYWRYMRQKQGPASEAVQSALNELYFASPWVDSESPPLVYESTSGKIVGFLGIVVRKMCAGGHALRMAFGGNLVVHPESRSQLAAARLLGAFMGGKHDISLTDSANDTSRKLVERLGFRTIPGMNIHWVRPLRPAHFGLHALSRRAGAAMSAVKLMAEPFCRIADEIAARYSGASRAEPELHAAEADVTTLLQCFTQFRNGYSLWPEYSADSLQWILDYMEKRSGRGHLQKVVLRDEGGSVVGWYLYYVKPGAIGEVVQIGGDRKFTKAIVEHLVSDAWQHGLIALHGVVDPRKTVDFSGGGSFFTCRGGWTIAHSRQRELLDILNRGKVFLTRLDGEWCLDPGE